jgi:hypothetical protein
MIQTLEAEVDEQGNVRLARPVHFDRRRRVLVMVMAEDSLPTADESDEPWNYQSIDLPYRYLPTDLH